MNDFAQPLPSLGSCPPAPRGFQDATYSRQSDYTVDNNPTTLSKTFVPADQQLRLGEHAVHGGDALTEWHVHRSGVQQLNIVLKASNSRLRYPWESPDRFGVSDGYRWQIDLTA